jgi:hypothetical protein
LPQRYLLTGGATGERSAIKTDVTLPGIDACKVVDSMQLGILSFERQFIKKINEKKMEEKKFIRLTETVQSAG